jgi:hypothetical protein
VKADGSNSGKGHVTISSDAGWSRIALKQSQRIILNEGLARHAASTARKPSTTYCTASAASSTPSQRDGGDGADMLLDCLLGGFALSAPAVPHPKPFPTRGRERVAKSARNVSDKVLKSIRKIIASKRR